MRFFFIPVVIVLLLPATSGHAQLHRSTGKLTIRIDGSQKLQRVDGIGVNVNTRSWDGTNLEPALTLLLDSMHATIWRVIVESVEKWEDVNDNDDPFVADSGYYSRLYETPKFQKVWEMIGWLNRHGVTGKLMINFMGAVPLWMGGEVIRPGFEDEYIEMLVSFFDYARHVKHLQFGLVSLMNEPDIRKEGPTVSPEQYVRLLGKLITQMKIHGMEDTRYVAPDVAGMENGLNKYMPALMNDPMIMESISKFGLHSYAGYYAPVDSMIRKSNYPGTGFWITEWNAWCKGCDDGILGEYNYDFAARSFGYLLDLLRHGAGAAIAWEGYDSYYEHHAPSRFSYWGMLSYEPSTKQYLPRKNFYAIQQVSRFVLPGSRQLSISSSVKNFPILAFTDSLAEHTSIVGINTKHIPVTIEGQFSNMATIHELELYYTNASENLKHTASVKMNGQKFSVAIPADCIFTLYSAGFSPEKMAGNSKHPEPAGWYTGDIHVHRNCGDDIVLPEEKLRPMMDSNDLDVISVLADMGNGEVKYSQEDLKKINGADAPQSTSARIIHWDAEWHWDATYSQFANQALGGHLVLLGLNNASQRWEESPYKILDWAAGQHAVRGFAHMEYLNGKLQDTLNCCIPVDYPVEAALGNIDFISEDVYGNGSPNNGNYNSEAVIDAYYKLLNCGFRPALAAGTDYPCNDKEPLGTLLTYVGVKGKLTYRSWIDGIKEGKTVVSRNGHKEFLDLKINERYAPGDEIFLNTKGSLRLAVKWTATLPLSGRIELVKDGKIIGVQTGSVSPGSPLLFEITTNFLKSGWVCARRMDDQGHQLHSSPVYITIGKKPVRASAADARYFVTWIDNILKNSKPGGTWSRYFTHDIETVRKRYEKAKNIYERIANEAQNKN